MVSPGSLRLPAAALLVCCVALVLQACGSSRQSVASKPAAAILVASRAAASQANGVRVQSQVFEDAPDPKAGAKTKARLVSSLELQLGGAGGSARLALLGSETQAVRVGSTLYVKGGPGFDRRLQRLTGRHLAPGTWVKAAATDVRLAESAALTEPSGELSLLLADPALSLTKGATTTVDGRRAIELKTKGKLYVGAIYIAATGIPYPLLIVKQGQENARTTFTGWNQPVRLTAPTGAVELGGL